MPAAALGPAIWLGSFAKAARNDSSVVADRGVEAGVEGLRLSSEEGSESRADAGVGGGPAVANDNGVSATATAGCCCCSTSLSSSSEGATPKLEKRSSVCINPQKASSSCCVRADDGGEVEIELRVWRWGGRLNMVKGGVFVETTEVESD